MLTVFPDEEGGSGTMLVISELGVELEDENRVSNVLRSEKNV